MFDIRTLCVTMKARNLVNANTKSQH